MPTILLCLSLMPLLHDFSRKPHCPATTFTPSWHKQRRKPCNTAKVNVVVHYTELDQIKSPWDEFSLPLRTNWAEDMNTLGVKLSSERLYVIMTPNKMSAAFALCCWMSEGLFSTPPAPYFLFKIEKKNAHTHTHINPNIHTHAPCPLSLLIIMLILLAVFTHAWYYVVLFSLTFQTTYPILNGY